MKRIFDLMLSSLLLVLLCAPLLLLCLMVRLRLGRPVFFRQERPGLGGRIFTMYKFRSMTGECDREGRLLPDARRLVAFGRWLRRTSLDELPELWNVFRGDMSLVGPRPLLVEYLPLYTKRQLRRQDVRPGLTGWAQVNGRNSLSWEEKFEFDVWYVENQSFSLDVKILWLTLVHLLRPRGIASDGHATMPRFTGAEANQKDAHPGD